MRFQLSEEQVPFRHLPIPAKYWRTRPSALAEFRPPMLGGYGGREEQGIGGKEPSTFARDFRYLRCHPRTEWVPPTPTRTDADVRIRDPNAWQRQRQPWSRHIRGLKTARLRRCLEGMRLIGRL